MHFATRLATLSILVGFPLSSSALASPQAGPSCVDQHDGASENSLGLDFAADFAWIATFGAPGVTTTITSISTCFGTPAFPGNFAPSSNVTVAVWSDPGNDFDPADGILEAIAIAPVSLSSVDTDVLQRIELPTPVTITGVFFAGAYVTIPANSFPMPLDTNGPSDCLAGRGTWAYWTIPGAFNPFTLGTQSRSLICAPFIPQGNALLSVNCGPAPLGTRRCFGDGSGAACPCGNTGLTGRGCENSFGTGGGSLDAEGAASLSADTVLLRGSFLPTTTSALFFQGTLPAGAGGLGVAFGDGLRCVAGGQIRLGTNFATGGLATFGFNVPGDPLVSVAGSIPTPGVTRDYQIWYRNAPAFCTPSTFNLTNAVRIQWTP